MMKQLELGCITATYAVSCLVTKFGSNKHIEEIVDTPVLLIYQTILSHIISHITPKDLLHFLFTTLDKNSTNFLTTHILRITIFILNMV